MIVGVYFDPFPMLVLCSKYCQGADVTHPGPGIQRPSVAGIVSSVDMHACQYTATCSVQPPRTESITDLKSMMKVLVSLLTARYLSDFLFTLSEVIR